jgi:hypothetical protein
MNITKTYRHVRRSCMDCGELVYEYRQEGLSFELYTAPCACEGTRPVSQKQTGTNPPEIPDS